MKTFNKLVLIKDSNKVGLILYQTNANAQSYSISEHTKHLTEISNEIFYVLTVKPFKICGPLWRHELIFL